jgi:hypothetical protein
MLVLPVAAQSVYLEQQAPPVSAGARGNAFELGVSAGFTYGWQGTFTNSYSAAVRDPGGGGALELEPLWRILPHVAVGVYGFGAQLGPTAAQPMSGDLLQAGAGVEGTAHILPNSQLDPWVTLGTGWRGQWLPYFQQVTRPSAENGWEFVRVRAGLDSRINAGLALGPVIGASVTRYYTQSIQGSPWSPGPQGDNVYIFAGVRATLDFPVNTPARAP